jgi:hypothetical protein
VTRNPVNHPGTKHIDVRYFAMRDWIQEGKLDVSYLSTNDMIADALTKPLNGRNLREPCEGMGMSFESRNHAGALTAKGSEMISRDRRT